jgi:hypothetical protein
VEQDRPGRPREIISPAVARNAFASFRLVVASPPGKPYALHVGHNPDDVFQITLYREVPVKSGARWIPDILERLSPPATGFVPLTGAGGPQRAVTYWMDVWVPAHAPVRRVRVEAQLNVGSDWIIYPMEFRIQQATVPAVGVASGALPPLAASSTEAALGPLHDFLCSKSEQRLPAAGGLTVRGFIRRNALQDAALARALEPAIGRPALESALLAILGAPDVKSWCEAAGNPGQSKVDPEIYLKVRDYLYKASSK